MGKKYEAPKHKQLLKALFEEFKASYLEDAKDEAKMENEDESISNSVDNLNNLKVDDFEEDMFDKITDWFERRI